MLCYSHHTLQENLYKKAPPSGNFDPMFAWALFLPASYHTLCRDIIRISLENQCSLHLRLVEVAVSIRPP